MSNIYTLDIICMYIYILHMYIYTTNCSEWCLMIACCGDLFVYTYIYTYIIYMYIQIYNIIYIHIFVYKYINRFISQSKHYVCIYCPNACYMNNSLLNILKIHMF